MNRKIALYALAVLIAIAAPFTRPAFAEPSQAQLQAQAKISEPKARELALAKVPGGKIKSSELEEEHDRLVWSFDIATEGSKNITEVQVDAKTGAIVSVENETPKDQEKEAKADKEEGKSK